MDFFITGYNGYLGNILQQGISNLGFNAYDVNSLSNSTQSRIDITTPFSLNKPKADCVIIHAAGKAHSIPKTQQEKDLFYKVNYEGTVNLCNAMEPFTDVIRGFVFISTVSVYGLDTGSNIHEDYALNADTPYGKSKIQAENYLREWGDKKNIPILILRLPLIAGPNPPGNLGKMISGIKTGRYYSIKGGLARRSVVMGLDVAGCIVENIGKAGTYNLTDGYHPQFREIEALIATQLNKRIPKSLPGILGVTLGYIGDVFPFFPVNSATILKMSTDLYFDDRKAARDLHWKPSKVIDTFKIK